VLVPKAHSDKFYRLPDVGEQVLCVFLPSGVEQGFAIGALYSRADATPAASQDRHIVQYADGTRTEYDRASHTITITIGDTAATLDREKVLLTAGGVQVLIDGTGLHTTATRTSTAVCRLAVITPAARRNLLQKTGGRGSVGKT
jgi:phage baseplate assembly protein V